MIVLFYTNIIVDILTNRHPFCKNSIACYEKAIIHRDKVFVSTVSVADVMYLTRKYFSDTKNQLETVYNFINSMKIAKVTSKDLRFAFTRVMVDFEDAIQAYCAKRYSIKYIITRNKKDFKISPVKAIEPSEFLAL